MWETSCLFVLFVEYVCVVLFLSFLFLLFLLFVFCVVFAFCICLLFRFCVCCFDICFVVAFNLLCVCVCVRARLCVCACVRARMSWCHTMPHFNCRLRGTISRISALWRCPALEGEASAGVDPFFLKDSEVLTHRVQANVVEVFRRHCCLGGPILESWFWRIAFIPFWASNNLKQSLSRAHVHTYIIRLRRGLAPW